MATKQKKNPLDYSHVKIQKFLMVPIKIAIQRYHVGKTMINHPPVIRIFIIGGIAETIPSRLGGLRHCFTHIGEFDGICIWQIYHISTIYHRIHLFHVGNKPYFYHICRYVPKNAGIHGALWLGFYKPQLEVQWIQWIVPKPSGSSGCFWQIQIYCYKWLENDGKMVI